MATLERIHTRVAALTPRHPCWARVLHLHHGPLINPPRQEQGFTPHGGPNLAKNCPCDHCRAALRPSLFAQCALSPLPNHKGLMALQVAVFSHDTSLNYNKIKTRNVLEYFCYKTKKTNYYITCGALVKTVKNAKVRKIIESTKYFILEEDETCAL